jgi:uncharacterized cofD-like protein
VTVLGGGHGLATTIAAARCYAGSITAVVSVADDGGSSGRLRQIAGIPAPGDLRRCLVAMAADGSPWAPAFEYRFPSGDLEGHALGNLIIAGLANATGDFGQALDLAADLLGAVGRVLPATSVPVVLKADSAGTEVIGQVNVSEAGSIRSVSVVPADAPAPSEVVEAIGAADQIVLGPGSLFTSVLAVAAVPAIREAIAARTGGRVYVCNLRPQPPETSRFSDADHVRAVLDHGVVLDAVVLPRRRQVTEVDRTRDRDAHPGEPLVPGGSQPEEGMLYGVRTLAADLDRADGTGHDPRRLAAVLEQLT